MTDKKNENLKKLLDKFFTSEHARELTENINSADQLLADTPAPIPDAELIAKIKAKTAQNLHQRQTVKTFKRALYKAASIAALFFILASITVKLFEKPNSKPQQRVITASIIPSAIWDSVSLLEDDEDLAILNAEIDEMEGALISLQLNETTNNETDPVTELEIELIEINSDFWKG